MSEEQMEKKVLALKYRPKRFEDLVGQSTISQTLSLALDSNRLSHAYLFSGLRGSGKTSTARIMAKALLCSNGPTSKPCEVCENCKSANANRHLDIIEMDAASNRGIDDIKDLIEHTKYKPSSARFKVFIIDEVHMLTTQAFNALLKTLEEPPGFVKFILATTDPLKLPATILSRTQHFRFNKIAPSDVLHHLSHILNEENIDFETPALEILTRSGQGSLRDTLTLLDQAIIFSKGKVTTTAVVDMLGLIEPKLMEKLFDIILKKGDTFEIVKELENYEISQVCDEMTIYLKQKMLEKDARFDLLVFDRFFRILSDAKHLLSMNSDGGFVLILTLSKMIEATNLKTIDDIINQVEEIEVKPVVKEAISTKKVIEHSVNDKNHVYDDQKVTLDKQYFENKKQIDNPNDEIINVENETTLSIDSVNAIPTVPPIEEVESLEELQNEEKEESKESVKESFVQKSSPYAFPTPFDEFEESDDFEAVEEKLEESVKLEEPLKIEELKEAPVEKEEKEEINEEPSKEEVEEVVYEPIVEPQVEEEPKQLSENERLYKKLIEKVYERDYDLGELFEKNFLYKNFEDKRLEISSYAVGDERKTLLKHYGVLKLFIYDIFGNDIEIKFIKAEPTQESVEKKSDFQSEVKEEKKEPDALENNENETGSMIEDIEVGSGCVADMNKVVNPTPSQKELQLNDILNSPQLNAAKELLRVKKITVKTKT
ncbi:DNA polymerase III subunit gamma/tau [Halarcobacter anaerophilus]|uniref:DNA polymerase III subunit gamma/tau n=1 Tax=Halarcobacter anaerophilus TaxID=877500 RepID=A0A4Q0Y0Z0_9BACT|nr:DNA polymerase III subunit gamma/tau [Halarcobacter anaerophilus]QDF30027.1 DNA polymerase III, gamma and tau subunits [Halarcobacter anaerophilus]RXJ63075.1 DNA polymerase III subunit gamma/tau [Halarcobacter anaerophilus]